MYLLNDKLINIDAPFEADDIQYANLRDPKLRDKLGVVEKPDPELPDARFYYSTQNEDGSLNVVPKSVDQIKQIIKQSIADKRYQQEISGIRLPDGSFISTDRDSQSKISGSLLFVQRNPSALIDWKGSEGWVSLNKAQIESIADAVAIHVQSCFTNERNLLRELEAMTGVEEIITRFG